ncbi:hypothetical protein AABB24_003128, partial [Solanum stoloniferum]
ITILHYHLARSSHIILRSLFCNNSHFSYYAFTPFLHSLGFLLFVLQASTMTSNVQEKGEGDGEPLIVNHIYDSAIVPPPILAADFNFLYLYEFLVNRVFLGGLPHEDPNLHIKNFLLVCALHRQKNVSDDAFRLRLFPFSLKGKARSWLDDLPARSIHNWDELLEAFLDEFFPRGVIVELRCRVSTFKQ